MRPDEISAVWPSPEQIARAVFVAAALEGDDPIDVLQGSAGARSRTYAFLALAFEFPTAPRSALARKFGKAEGANGARKALVAGAWSWFDLGRLNAVRAALGLPDMTLEDAKAAPLLYCGRSWEEFADRGAEQREAPTSSAVEPAAGSGGDEKPAPIIEDRALVEEAAPLASPGVASPEAGGGSDIPPATIPKAERVAAVERRKAFLRGEPPEAREIEDKRRPRNELTDRLLSESHRGVTSFRPDPPAEKRGAVNVTADLMGDPSPERSALGRPI